MYHYESCGLPDVWLLNGYQTHETPYGDGISIDNIEGLHRAIAHSIINSASKMTGAELRFLRKELDLSQKRLGAMLGVEDQTVANWEKGTPTSMASRFIKVIASAQLNSKQVQQLIDELSELDRKEHEALYFEAADSQWNATEAIAA